MTHTQPRCRLRTANRLAAAATVLAAASSALSAPATTPATKPTGHDRSVERDAHTAIDRGLRFLVASQRPDGGWENYGQSDPAITALLAKCFIQHPGYGPSHPVTRRAIAFVTRFVQEDGGIYVPDIGLRNYYTSVALVALSATKDPAHEKTIANARRFLVKGQWDEEEGHEPDSVWYGGAGYGRQKRPDLSNTQLMLEALRQSGLPPDHAVYKKALVFVQRCQMSSTSNDQPLARGVEDGGFIYTPANGGESKAGTVVVDGRPRLRSYGSMTYAGFKSMLYANLSRNDPRVQAAFDWVRRHYTLDHNPNMPDAQSLEGLYYYYHVFSKALAAWGQDRIIDAQGVSHDWRRDLCHALLQRQHSDGSWVNSADRWYESNPALVTAYAVLALQTALGSA